MPISTQDALTTAIAELAQLLLHEESVNTTLQRVATSAVHLIDAVEEVGVTLLHDDRPATDAATGGVVYEVDNFQYEVDQGPCLHALLSGEPVEIQSMESDQRWPTYARFAADRGILSSLSIPLTLDGQISPAAPRDAEPSIAEAVEHGRVGVMNLYARTKASFTDDERWAALTFGHHAAVAIRNANTYQAAQRLTADLQTALGSRATIEQAKGILMARCSCSPDDAFSLLRQRSQDENRKLRDVADELVTEVTPAPMPSIVAVNDPQPELAAD